MVKAKIVKKEWHPILAPKIFQNAVLGETPVYDPDQMIGKGITQNLMNLTNDVKRQNININFKVVNVQNGKAFTDIVGYYMAQSSVRRLVRKNIEKIDMSFSCKTSDNKNLQIKPLLITRSATVGSVVAKLRRNTKDFLVKYIGAISYDNFVKDLIDHKMQNLLRKDLNKIYPLRICEIRSMEIVDLEKNKQAESKAAKSSKKEKLARKAEERKGAEKREEKAKESKEAEKKEIKSGEKKEDSKAAEKEEKPAEVKESKEAVEKVQKSE